VNPWTNFDPISVVKMTVLTSFAFMILALILYSKKSMFEQLDKKLLLVSTLFVVFIFSTFLFSGAPKSQQFWGMFGRNTGILSYISLLIVFVGACLVAVPIFYRNIVNALISTAVPMTLYCIIQMLGKDPIGWSLQQTFGTLGNINFLSAFLGLVIAACFAMAIDCEIMLTKRILLALLAVTDFYIAASTGSIQGVLIAIAGVAVVLFIWMGKLAKSTLLRSLYSLISVSAACVGAFGLANKGPLAAFLFQESNVLRTDYWHAGWQMTTDKPVFGVGMDSYGDWYREARGSISTLRGSPDRTANTAHNIFLDISSNGGFPLLISYIALLYFCVRAIFRLLNQSKGIYDSTFAALGAVWIAYQVQALVSINQLGVGVWGWLFSGALIGYEACTKSKVQLGTQNKSRNWISQNRRKLLPAAAGLSAIAGFALGFALSFPALHADSKHFAALKSGSIQNLISSSKMPGTTAFHMSQVIQKASSANLQSEAREVDERLINRFPRDYFGWVARYDLAATSPAERLAAINSLRKLDPFNPTIPQS
jgi:O-antigen ligase